MPTPRHKDPIRPQNDPLFSGKLRKPIPHEFVLDALAELAPRTNPMFGCLAVYVEDKIVLILRDKREPATDNGVWLCTTQEHHESLRREFPNLRSIEVLGKEVTGWQVLPADAPDFEEAALRACELVIARDPRIGKVPKSRRNPEGKSAAKSPVRSKAAKSAVKTGAKPNTVDEYLARVPEPGRSTLNKIRAAIRSAVPAETAEVISYGIPAFRGKGFLIWYAAFAKHCSLFVLSGSQLERFKDELEGYETSKGTIRFPLDKPLPAALVKRLVKARIALNERRRQR